MPSLVEALAESYAYISNAATMYLMRMDQWGTDTTRAMILKKYASEMWSDVAHLVLQEMAQYSASDISKDLAELQSAVVARITKFDPTSYKFRLNPSKLTFNGQKVQSIIQTNRGFDISTWTNGIDTWSYTGTSGYLKPPSVFLRLGIRDVRLSPAWLRFMMFNKFYHENHGELLMIFEDVLMKCFLVDFRYDRDADNPWQISYSFTVKSDYNAKISLLIGDISTFFEQAKDLFSQDWRGELGLKDVASVVSDLV